MPQQKGRRQATAVFKSQEGRREILACYDRFLAQVDFAYLERTVEILFGSTYMLESGEKNLPPIFLFHGSTSNSSAWFADIKELSKQFHVFAVDLIGDAGHSAETRLNMKSDEYAIWIKELLEKTGVEKALFMGNSLGAWMCLKFASVFPEKVDKLVLITAADIAPIRFCLSFS
jgi:pimeloyl-ACP methyl ester carboxylesterase